MNLTVNAFFRCYMFHVGAQELSNRARCQARISSIVLGIFTAGIIHLICRIAFYNRSFRVIPSQNTSRLAQAAQPVLAKAPAPAPFTQEPSKLITLVDAINYVPKKSIPPIITPKPPSPPEPPVVTSSTPLAKSGKPVTQNLPIYSTAHLDVDSDPKAKGHYLFKVLSTIDVQKPTQAYLIEGKKTKINGNKLLFPANSKIILETTNLKKHLQNQLLNLQTKFTELTLFLKTPSKETFTKSIVDLIAPGIAKLESEVGELQKQKAELEAEVARKNKEKSDLQADFPKVSKLLQMDITNYLASLSTSYEEGQIQKINSPLHNELRLLDIWKGYVQSPNNRLPDSMQLELEDENKKHEKTIREMTDHVSQIETFLRTRSVVDYLPCMFGQKVKQMPDLSNVNGFNFTALLPVEKTTNKAPFHPTVNMMSQEVLVAIAYDDAGTQFGTRTLMSYYPKENIPIQGRNNKQDIDWQLNPLTDQQVQGIAEENPALVEEVMGGGLNMLVLKLKTTTPMRDPNLIAKGGGAPRANVGVITGGQVNNQNYSKSAYTGDFEYIPNTAMFIRMSGLACNKIIPGSPLMSPVLRLAEEVTAAGDARLQSFV